MKNVDFDNVQEGTEGSFERIEPNGYICVITGMKDVSSNEYVMLTYDIAEGEHKAFYSDGYYDDRPWMHSVALSYKDSALSMLKGRLMRIQESNAGFDPFDAWKKEDLMSFIGKQFGGVFDFEEYIGENDGKKVIRKSIKLRQFKNTEDIRSDNYKLPGTKPISDKYLAQHGVTREELEANSSNEGEKAPEKYDTKDVPF